MKFRILFNQKYPDDFTEEEKETLKNFLVKVPNSSFHEYEVDSKYINAFSLYRLLVRLGFSGIKLKPVKFKDDRDIIGIYEMFKPFKFDDRIVLEISDYVSYSKFFSSSFLTAEM